MDTIRPGSQGHIDPIINDKRHIERRQSGFDSRGLMDEKPGGNIFFPKLDTGHSTPDGL
jgi:hypothetical protein